MTGLSPLQAVCKQIANKYINTGLVIGNRIRIMGDASGKAGSADRQEARSFYYTIVKELQINPAQIYIRGANPTHVYSVNTINYALSCLPDGVLVLNNVGELVDDIRHAYMDDRSLEKAKKEHGLHILDAWRYLMDFWFSYFGGRYVTDDKVVQKNIDSLSKRAIAQD